MRTRRLGGTGLDITTVGIGAWAIGGEWAYGWGPQDDRESIATLRRALELGVNWIDTAAVYGLGHSEEVVGRALREVPLPDRPLVFTKCGLVWNARGKIRHRLTESSIRDEVEGSLSRLSVDVIDLYQIHWPSFPPGAPAPELEEGWTTLTRLREEGKVRHIGVSNFEVAQLDRVGSIGNVDSLQPPYSLVERGIEAEILPYCAEKGIGVIVYSPMQSGLLSGKMTRERIASLPRGDWRRYSEDFREPRLSRNLVVVDRLRVVSGRIGKTIAQTAIAWTLRDPTVTGAIVGARRPQQVEEIVGAWEVTLSDQDVAFLSPPV